MDPPDLVLIQIVVQTVVDQNTEDWRSVRPVKQNVEAASRSGRGGQRKILLPEIM